MFTINQNCSALIDAINEWESETSERHKVATGLLDRVKKFGNTDLMTDALNEVLQPMYAATTDLHARPEVDKLYSKLNAVICQIVSINEVAQQSRQFWLESIASKAENDVREAAQAAELHAGGALEAQRIRDLLDRHPEPLPAA